MSNVCVCAGDANWYGGPGMLIGPSDLCLQGKMSWWHILSFRGKP